MQAELNVEEIVRDRSLKVNWWLLKIYCSNVEVCFSCMHFIIDFFADI